jgi:hypothetical protein
MESAVDEHILDILEALSDIQRISGIYFPSPEEFSAEEARIILEVRELMAGRVVRGSWSSVRTEFELAAGADLARVLYSPDTSFRFERDETLQFAGHDITIGRVRTQLLSAQTSNPKAIQDEVDSGRRRLTVELIPGSNAEFVRQRIGPSRDGAVGAP